MPRQNLVAVGIVLGIVVGISMLLWAASGPAPTTTDAAEPRSPTPTSRAATGAVEQAPANLAADATVARTAASPDPTAAANDRLQVQLRVRTADGTPAAGASVHFVDISAILVDPTRAQVWQQLAPDYEQAIRHFGAETTCDAEGLARWPWTGARDGNWLVVARLGEQSGSMEFATTLRPTVVQELQLGPETTFLVRVVSPDGTPQSQVVLHAQGTRMAPDGTDDQHAYFAVGHSSADGIAVFHHAQYWSHSVAARGPNRPFLVTVDAPGQDAQVELDAAALPREPVVLTIHPAGSMLVRAIDGQGQAMPVGTMLVCVEDPDGTQPWLWCLPQAGTYTATQVAIGKRWRIWSPGMTATSAIFDGPRTAGELVSIEVRGAPVPVLVGQLLRDGAPCADTQFLVIDASVQTPNLRTDAAGRFRFDLKHDEVGETVQELTFRVPTTPGEPTLTAVWRGDLTLQAQEHQLGALDLEPTAELPLLVAGQITGELDDFRSVHLSLDWDPAVTSDRPELELDHATGAFTFRGVRHDGTLRLTAGSRNHLPIEPQECSIGQTGVRIELQTGSRLLAAFPGLSRELAQCCEPKLYEQDDLEREDAVDPSKPVWSTDGCTFAWSNLPPGTYQLLVLCAGSKHPVLELDDLVVQAGKPCDDPRLRNLTLPALRVLSLTLPARPRDASIEFDHRSILVLDGNQVVSEACEQSDGTFLLAAPGPVDLLARAQGYQERLLRGVDGNLAIDLEPGLPVTLQILAPDLPRHWCATILLEPREPRTLPGTPMALGSTWRDGDVALTVPAAGTYDLTGSLTTNDGELDLVLTPSRIVIEPTGGTFPIRLAIKR